MVRFSKMHYEAIAAQLKSSRPLVSAVEDGQWRRDVRGIADMFQLDNPRFNRSQFMLAVGYNRVTVS